MAKVGRVLRPGVARALLLGCLLLPACAVQAQPVRAVGLNRSSPRATYDYMVAMVAALQTEAEWATFSPGFKRRLSEAAGRNVDYGDYSQARATFAGNDRRELKLFLESEFVEETFLSDREATITIQAGSRRLRPRLVKLSTWEITVTGENQPVSGFVRRIGDSIRITAEGDVQARVTPESNTASFLKDIPADSIESLSMKSEWFLEDFGGIEEVVQEGLRGGARPDDGARTPVVPPPSAPEPVPVAPYPGSPDALPSPSPVDAPGGSPDG